VQQPPQPTDKLRFTGALAKTAIYAKAGFSLQSIPSAEVAVAQLCLANC